MFCIVLIRWRCSIQIDSPDSALGYENLSQQKKKNLSTSPNLLHPRQHTEGRGGAKTGGRGSDVTHQRY